MARSPAAPLSRYLNDPWARQRDVPGARFVRRDPDSTVTRAPTSGLENGCCKPRLAGSGIVSARSATVRPRSVLDLDRRAGRSVTNVSSSATRSAWGVAAECKISIDPLLKRARHAKLPKPPDRRLRKRLVRQISERPSAPQSQRRAQPCGSEPRLGRIRLADQTLEPVKGQAARAAGHSPALSRESQHPAPPSVFRNYDTPHLQRRAPDSGDRHLVKALVP